jgi:hypothetical protein
MAIPGKMPVFPLVALTLFFVLEIAPEAGRGAMGTYVHTVEPIGRV